MDVDPRRLGVLLAVHRSGGVLAAADTMGVTASAISQQIHRLEAEVGVAVLDRQPSGAVLTAAGRVLVESAERIESELADARRSLLNMGDAVTGTVVVGAFQTVIRALLVPMVLTLDEYLPGVELSLRELEPDDAQRELRAGSLDLTVVETDSSAPHTTPRGMRDVPILEEPWLVVMPASAPLPTTLHDLEGETWLGVEPGTASYRATERLTTSFRMRPEVAHSYADYDVAISMVSAGLGIAVLPSLALQGKVPEGIQTAALPGLGARRVMLRHRVTRTEPRPVVQAVVDEIVRAAAQLELDPT